MQSRNLLIVAALIGCAMAYYPQSVSVTQLQAGVLTNGVLAANGSNYAAAVYSFFVPANASYYNVTIKNTNSNACGLYAFYRTDGAPCSSSAYPSSDWYCGNVPSDYIYSSGSTQSFYAGESSSLSEFKTNDYVYFSVAKSSTSYTGDVCSFSIIVQVNSDCAAGTLPTSLGGSGALTCTAYTQVNNFGTSTFNISSPGSTGYFALWATNVALSTGMIQVVMNISDTNGYLYGNQYSSYGYSADYKCSQSSYSSSGSDYYVYTMNCYTPRSGLFVFTLKENYDFNGTISFTFTNCSGTGMGGFNCSFPESPLNISALTLGPMTVTIPYRSGYLSEYMNIYYIDVPANFVGPDVALYFTSAQSDYLLTRINGYPEYYSYYGYEVSEEVQSISSTAGSTQWGLSQFDYVFPARYYFALSCGSSSYGSCNITISYNATQVTSGAMTTGSSTGVTGVSSTTGSSTNSTGSASTTGMQTSTNTSGTAVTTGITTAMMSTTASGSLTTGQEKSGFEVVIPSLVLGLAAMFF